MRIFVDANVLFTAAYSPNGKAALLLENLALVILTSDYATEEARRNLINKNPDAVAAFEILMATITIVPSVYGESCPLPLPKKDHPIFLTALKEKATHLHTGDMKDFGPHMNQPNKSGGVIIQTVAEFLATF